MLGNGIKTMRRLIAIATITTAVVMPSAAWAWGHEGHQVVALIATRELSPAAILLCPRVSGGECFSRLTSSSESEARSRAPSPDLSGAECS